VGTTPEDWIDLRPPPRAAAGKADVVFGKGWSDGGVEAVAFQGGAAYLTDLERSLLDALHDPPKAGGFANVLVAWRRGSERWDLAKLLRYADSGPVMRQRVGYLVERLGGSHLVLDEWRTRLQRGGSLRLLASEPYSATFSERWNLSLNVPESVLGALDG
jgi:predicted transcriptional regulator of viral defense system